MLLNCKNGKNSAKKKKAWKSSDGIWSEIWSEIFSQSTSAAMEKYSSDGLSHWLYYRIFTLPGTANASYTRKDQNFNGISECKESPFKSYNHKPVLLLVNVAFSPQFYNSNQT